MKGLTDILKIFCCVFTAIVLTPSIGPAVSLEDEILEELDREVSDLNKKPPQIEKPKAAKPKTRKPNTDMDDKTGSMMNLAQSQFDRGNYDETIKILKPAIDTLPRAGLLLLAKAYEAKKDYLNEIKTLELCIAKNPKDYVVRTAYGHALLRQQGRVDDALKAFQEARTLNPLYRPAYEALAEELEKKGERFEARNVLEDMRKRFGADAKILSSLCRLWALDQYNEATKVTCEQAIERAPDVPENHMYLGLALMNLEKTKEAQRVLSSASKRFPASEPVQWALGELAISKNDMVTAYNYFKRAAAADPKSVRAWIGYGKAAFELQKNEEALQAFIKACKLNRHEVREFRSAIGQLRVRRDTAWQAKFEMGINSCM